MPAGKATRGSLTFLTNWRSCHFTCQQGLIILSSSLASQELSSSFKKQAMPLLEYLSCIWVEMNITQYYAQVLFLFVHLQVKTTEADDGFREVLAPWKSSLPEVKVSMQSFVLWIKVSSSMWWKGNRCGPGIQGHNALCCPCPWAVVCPSTNCFYSSTSLLHLHLSWLTVVIFEVPSSSDIAWLPSYS